MIGLDTRYYIADKADAESAAQREAARRLIARPVKRLGLLPRVIAPA